MRLVSTLRRAPSLCAAAKAPDYLMVLFIYLLFFLSFPGGKKKMDPIPDLIDFIPPRPAGFYFFLFCF